MTCSADRTASGTMTVRSVRTDGQSHGGCASGESSGMIYGDPIGTSDLPRARRDSRDLALEILLPH